MPFTIELLNDLGLLITSTTTNAVTGQYTFNNVAPVNHTVREVQQTDWFQSEPAPTDPNWAVPAGDVTNGGVAGGRDFGNFRKGEIHGLKYEDLNGNGLRDAGEPGLSGWTFDLVLGTTVIDTVTSLADDPTTTTVDETGTFSFRGPGPDFEGLNPGQYTVVERLDQPGWFASPPGSNVVAVQLLSGRILQPEPVGGDADPQTLPELNFGNLRLGEINGLKFLDHNANGIQDPGDEQLPNWQITISGFDGLGRPVTVSVPNPTTLTDANGEYSFTGIWPGTYTISETLQGGYRQSAPAGGTFTVRVDSGEVIGDPDPLALNPMLAFGNYLPGRISGYKFHDRDGDQVRDLGEEYLDGWTIQLLDDQGNAILDGGGNPITVVTGGTNFGGDGLDNDNDTIVDEADERGYYELTLLDPGDYLVQEILQPGWAQTLPLQGMLGLPVSLLSGASETNVNFGNAQFITLSGHKYHDRNANGVRDAGEEGLSGWTIQLFSDQDNVNPFASVVTGTDGSYTFGFANGHEIPAGNWTLREVAQPGWVGRAPEAGEFGVNAASGEVVEGLDFGNYQPVELHGRVFHDNDGNDQFDSGPDQYLDGWQVQLVDRNGNPALDSSGNPIAIATTMSMDLNGNSTIDADEVGWYWISDVVPGDYVLRVLMQSGWAPVTGGAVTLNQGQDLDGDPSTLFDAVAIPDESGDREITVASGESHTDLDFANFQFVTIAGRKFNDHDGEGDLDAQTDEFLPNWEFELYDDQGNLVATTATRPYDLNEDGTLDPGEEFVYAFSTVNDIRVRPGSYEVREVQQDGWIQSAPQTVGHSVTVNSNGDDIDNNFGNYRGAVITGRKFEDLNADTVRNPGEPYLDGWLIQLIDANDDVALDSNGQRMEVFTRNVDLNDDGVLDPETEYGYYEFTNVPTGAYTIREVLRPGWTQSFPNPNAPLPQSHDFTTTMVMPEAIHNNIDFGNFRIGGIHGRKWNDLNADGQRDAGEPWLNGWVIELLDSSGNLIATTTTADLDLNGDNVFDPETESGWYSFNDLQPATYRVREQQQTGWTSTVPVSGANAQEARNLDEQLDLFTTGNLFENQHGRFERWFRSGANGQWYFVVPGGEVFQWDGVQGSGSGTLVAELDARFYRDPSLIYDAGIPDVLVVSVASGRPVENANFGNFQDATISGRKYHDLNQNGQHDSQEPFLNGWEIQLVDSRGALVATTVTGTQSQEQGWFTFTNVLPGDYTLREILQPGWRRTAPLGDSVQELAFQLDQELGLYVDGSVLEDRFGGGEKWFRAAENADQWYYILPDGRLFLWDTTPSTLSGTLVATLTAAYHQDHNLLVNATDPGVFQVNLTGGATSGGHMFGNFQLPGSITGQKYHDRNGNGVRDLDEEYLNGFTIRLFDTSGNLIATDVTSDRDLNGDSIIDPNTERGWYSFTDLGSGDYVLQEDVVLPWIQGTPAGGPQPTLAQQVQNQFGLSLQNDLRHNRLGLDEKYYLGTNGNEYYITPDGRLFEVESETVSVEVAQLDPAYHANPRLLAEAPDPIITLVGNQGLTGYDFGNYQLATIEGRKFHDLNADGTHNPGEPYLNGWTIQLVTADGVVWATAVTRDVDRNGDGQIDPETETGWYTFTDIVPAPGYELQEVTQDGWMQSAPNPDAASMLAFELDQQLDLRFVGNDFFNFGGLNEKWLRDSTGRWYYITPEGLLYRWNRGTGMGGTPLTGELIATLSPRFYETPRLLADAQNPELVVISGQTVRGFDFGNFQLAEIHGRKFHDVNTDGVRDAGEPYLNNWVIDLLNENGDVVGTTTTHDVDLNADGTIDPETETGWYWFENLVPGTYWVQERLRPAWLPSAPREQGVDERGETVTEIAGPDAREAYLLNEEFKLLPTPTLWPNWGGRNEIWLHGTLGRDGAGGAWYFITPDGNFYRWDGSPREALTGDLLTTLDPVYHRRPELLYNASDASRLTLASGTNATLNFGNYQTLDDLFGDNGFGNLLDP